jgi:hypothetical protein
VPAALSGRFRAVQLLVFTTVGLGALVAAYGFGLGGTIAFLIFLLILFIGIFVRAAHPLLEHLKP